MEHASSLTMFVGNKWKFPVLILIIATLFGIYVNFIPHKDYNYPVHVDEWVHLTRTKDVIKNGSQPQVDSFIGESPAGIESTMGFYVFLSELWFLTGISWMSLFKYLPTLFFLFTLLSVFILSRRYSCGLESVALVSLIPTSVRILGPGFLVPIALGIFFIPLSLFLAFNPKISFYHIPLFAINVFLWYMHEPTALAVFIMLIIFSVLNFKENKIRSLGILTIIVLALLMSHHSSQIIPEATSVASTRILSPYPPMKEIFKIFGITPTVLFVLGVFLMSRENKIEYNTLVFSSITLLSLIVVFVRFDVGFIAMYDRSFMFLMVLMGIIAGFTLSKIASWKIEHTTFLLVFILFVPDILFFLLSRAGLIILQGYDYVWIKENMIALCLIIGVGYITSRLTNKNLVYPVVIFMAVVPTLLSHTQAPEYSYYHIIDDDEYKDFIWIRDNTPRGKTIIDPWKAISFVSVAERRVYSRIPSGPDKFYEERNYDVWKFFDDKCNDTHFLRKNNISIVYTTSRCENEDLLNPINNVYLVKE